MIINIFYNKNEKYRLCLFFYIKPITVAILAQAVKVCLFCVRNGKTSAADRHIQMTESMQSQMEAILLQMENLQLQLKNQQLQMEDLQLQMEALQLQMDDQQLHLGDQLLQIENLQGGVDELKKTDVNESESTSDMPASSRQNTPKRRHKVPSTKCDHAKPKLEYCFIGVDQCSPKCMGLHADELKQHELHSYIVALVDDTNREKVEKAIYLATDKDLTDSDWLDLVGKNTVTVDNVYKCLREVNRTLDLSEVKSLLKQLNATT
uniref:Uncharacterized protein n=1 Tax=viral metagenome TaxID=1070528 RepID=A0A6C0H727_9ZZZZ